MSDKGVIYRQDAIAKLKEHRKIFCKNRLDFTILPDKDKARVDEIDACISELINLPPAQSEPSIPLSWFDEQIERLKGLDNAFATLTAMQISGMVNKWKDEQDDWNNKPTSKA